MGVWGLVPDFLRKLHARLRGLFEAEWTWRLFLVLQAVGLIALLHLDLTDTSWDFLPQWKSYLNTFGWDFFEAWHWGKHDNTNWLALSYFPGPFLLAKAVDWIENARRAKP